MLKNLLRRLSTAALVLCCSLVFAQQEMEIIPLRAQTLDRVLPVLLPLLEPGGTLTGMNDQLFLRASARNRAEIRRVLETIDVPARRLVIRVSQDREREAASRGGTVTGQVVISNDRSRADIDARLWDAQGTRSERSGQMVQTVEGGRAFIQVGRSLPLPLRQAVIGPGGVVVEESVVYRDVGSGFFAVPRVNGDRVTLEISQQAESFSTAARGAIESQRLTTTVTGRLGEWIQLGGVSRQASGGGIGTFGAASASGSDSGAIWLLVEEIR